MKTLKYDDWQKGMYAISERISDCLADGDYEAFEQLTDEAHAHDDRYAKQTPGGSRTAGRLAFQAAWRLDGGYWGGLDGMDLAQELRKMGDNLARGKMTGDEIALIEAYLDELGNVN